jgi:hypothetical protein
MHSEPTILPSLCTTSTPTKSFQWEGTIQPSSPVSSLGNVIVLILSLFDNLQSRLKILS